MKPSYRSNKLIFKRYISWVFVILSFFVIFMFSSQNGQSSNGLSMYALRKILHFLNISGFKMVNDAGILEELHYLIRKTAHFLEYLVFTGLLYRALKLCSLSTLKSAILTLSACAACALLDESNQILTPNRTPNLMDVAVDVSGAVFILSAILLCQFLKKEG